MPDTVPTIYSIPTIIAVFLSKFILFVILISPALLIFIVVSYDYHYISLLCPSAFRSSGVTFFVKGSIHKFNFL